jgi:hypothetical protein
MHTRLRVIALAFALVLPTAAAEAQLGTPNTSALNSGAGIPLGSTELNSPGLSPLSSPPGVPAPLSGFPSAGGMGSTMGTGLSPLTTAPTPSFGSSAPSGLGVTNYGTGGIQPLPGSPYTSGLGARE